MSRVEALRVLYDFYFNRLQFCGCGTPEDTMIMLKETLAFLKEQSKDPSFDPSKVDFTAVGHTNDNLIDLYELKQDSSISNGIMLFILSVLSNTGAIEHKTTLRNSYLTNYGEEVLDAFLEIKDLNTLFEADFSKDF